MSRGSSAVEQLIRNQQAVGSNPTSGSIVLLFLVFIILVFTANPLYAEIGGSYQRIYTGAAYLSLEPVLTVPDDISLNVKGGFVFSRRVIMEVTLGLGRVPFPAGSYYFGTRMFYRVLIDHRGTPGLSFIIGANNRTKVGIDTGFELSKRLNNISFYFSILDKGLVTSANEIKSDLFIIPGVEIGLSKVTFLSLESGWSFDSSVAMISAAFLVAIY